jgi:UDP-N-acetylmuramoylalanine--D-glutamate ligase
MLLNVRPDHLNWHDSMEEYAADKLRIFEGQGPTDLALVSSRRSGEPGRYGQHRRGDDRHREGGGRWSREGAYCLRGRPLAEVGELPFLGPHNYENALFAAAAAERFAVGLENSPGRG